MQGHLTLSAYYQRPYQVSRPAPERVAPSSEMPSTQVYFYPKAGQTYRQQSRDHYECYNWAADQAGFDPTQPPGSAPANQRIEKRADYQRAMNACLDGRGYTMK